MENNSKKRALTEEELSQVSGGGTAFDIGYEELDKSLKKLKDFVNPFLEGYAPENKDDNSLYQCPNCGKSIVGINALYEHMGKCIG